MGKSSLALTAADQFSSSDVEPIRVVCHPTITFGKLIGQIATRMRDHMALKESEKKTFEASLNVSVLKVLYRIEKSNEKTTEKLEIDVNEAVSVLDALMPKDPSKERVVVIDELDAVEDPIFRSEIAFFIKQLGDNQARLRFIFAGIASNVSQLLVHHESAQRCMATIELKPLQLGILREVVVEGFKQLGMTIRDALAFRVACLSDGFPHFTHLIALKMAYAALDQETIPESVDDVTLLEDAIAGAVEDSEAVVKEAYDRAAQKYLSYETLLWAVADHYVVLRSTRDIYNSYLRICADLQAAKAKGRPVGLVEVADKAKVSRMLHSLKQPTHGIALVSERKSWFRFRLSMLRGYCRMVAASKGIDVGLDYLEADTRRPKVPFVGGAGVSGEDSLAELEGSHDEDGLDEDDGLDDDPESNDDA